MKKGLNIVGKITLGSALLIGAFMWTPNTTQAGIVEDTVGVYVGSQERSLLNEVDEVADDSSIKTRAAYIGLGSVRLYKVSPTRARIAGTTQGLQTCDDIYLDIYVDQYDLKNEDWNQWRYWEYHVSNADYLTRNMEIIVQTGHYYSVRGVHSCVKGNIVETVRTQTAGLYIGVTDEPV